jgi:hypothetical protein
MLPIVRTAGKTSLWLADNTGSARRGEAGHKYMALARLSKMISLPEASFTPRFEGCLDARSCASSIVPALPQNG